MLAALTFLVAVTLAQDAAPELYAVNAPVVLLQRAGLAEQRGDVHQALVLLGALEARMLAGEAVPDSLVVSALATLGRLRFEEGDLEGSAAAFRLLAGRFPGGGICPLCPGEGRLPTPAPAEEAS